MNNCRLVVFMLALGFALDATAQTRTVYACVIDAAAGLNWNGSRWETASYKPPPILLLTVTKYEDKVDLGFTGDSMILQEACQYTVYPKLGPLVEGSSASSHFRDLQGVRGCIGVGGQSVYFSEKNKRGGISTLLGAAATDRKRDSLVVMPFTCEKF